MALTMSRNAMRARIADQMRSGGFMRDIGLLLIGSGGAQLIVVAGAPILARIFKPAEFAALALLTSTVMIISRFSSLKYETAIATGRTRPEMGALALIAWRALVAVAVLSAIGALVCFPLLTERIGTQAAIFFCIALPLIVLFDGAIQIIITWSVRWREFKTVSANDVIRNGSSTATQAGLGLAGFSSAGLLLGQVIGTAMGLLVLMHRQSTRELIHHARRGGQRRGRVVARRFIDFPLFQMPKAIMNAAGRSAPTILIASFYTAAATGSFFFALRLTALPAQLVSQSLGRVLLQRFAQRWTKQKLPITRLLLGATGFFFCIAAPLVLIMFAYGVPIFTFALGEEWRTSGAIAAWTVLWSAGTIVGTPAQMAMTVMRQNRTMLALESTFLPLRLLPFPLFAASGDVNSAIAWCCAAAATYNATMICVAIFTAIRLGRRLAPAAITA